MLFRRKVRRALKDDTLQKALQRAAAQHFAKFQDTANAMDWEGLKKSARTIREDCVPRLPELIHRFREEAEKVGAVTHLAATAEQALAAVEDICRRHGARLIVKSKSMVSEEIHLNAHLERKGFRVVETDLGEWIVQLAGERPSHITAPALHKTKEDVAALLTQRLGRPVPADIQEMVKAAREELRRAFVEADIGISGANLAVAESGTLALVSNEGNARLVTTLPPVHIALVTVEKFVETLEQAATLVKALTTSSSGARLTAYVSFITGPSRTTDIEKQLVVGVHGPRELHIIILDNGRLEAAKDDVLRETLFCLKCGGCMLVCPVFQAVGGYTFGGPVYPGGIGALLTAVTRSEKDAAALAGLCADCKKCEAYCPVGIPTGDLLVKLKARRLPALWERSLSAVFRRKRLNELGARFLSALEGLGRPLRALSRIPLPWTKGRTIPRFQFRKKSTGPASGTSGSEKVYLFQGCLVKFFFPEIRDSVTRALSDLGFSVVAPDDQTCCGAPSLHLGALKDVRALASQNLDSFERENPRYIITVCPTGHSLLTKHYPQLDRRAARWADKVFAFTPFMIQRELAPQGVAAGESGPVYYHYPCHAVNEGQWTDEPGRLLRGLGFVPRVEDEPLSCCGFCGVFSVRNPEIAERFWSKKEASIRASGAPLVATDCPGCLFQMRTHFEGQKDGPQVFHSAELFAQALSRHPTQKTAGPSR